MVSDRNKAESRSQWWIQTTFLPFFVNLHPLWSTGKLHLPQCIRAGSHQKIATLCPATEIWLDGSEAHSSCIMCLALQFVIGGIDVNAVMSLWFYWLEGFKNEAQSCAWSWSDCPVFKVKYLCCVISVDTNPFLVLCGMNSGSCDPLYQPIGFLGLVLSD